jgi:hypothetical protein
VQGFPAQYVLVVRLFNFLLCIEHYIFNFNQRNNHRLWVIHDSLETPQMQINSTVRDESLSCLAAMFHILRNFGKAQAKYVATS